MSWVQTWKLQLPETISGFAVWLLENHTLPRPLLLPAPSSWSLTPPGGGWPLHLENVPTYSHHGRGGPCPPLPPLLTQARGLRSTRSFLAEVELLMTIPAESRSSSGRGLVFHPTARKQRHQERKEFPRSAGSSSLHTRLLQAPRDARKLSVRRHQVPQRGAVW